MVNAFVQRHLKWLAPLGLAFFVSACSNSAEMETLQGEVMGFEYELMYLPAHPNHTESRISQRVQGIMQYVGMQFSVTHPHSEIARFNEWRSTEPLVLTRELEGLLRQGLQLHEVSNGEIQLFVSEREAETPRVYIRNHQIVKSDPSVQVDLDGLLRGHMADRIADIFDLMNIQQYSVRVGQDYRVRAGKRGRQRPALTWDEVPDLSLQVREGAVSTRTTETGDFVIVLHESAAISEALTRWFAGGDYERALATTEQHGIAAAVFVREDSGITRYNNAAFNAIVL
ncbi:FAD:protein FMN transferase [Aliidiomarina sanyensis]|uniref:FAD:protein FMN transferase n=1 Tax=Aliidiomarina sanyensis TaxID=1249555 RepID=A0A432WDK8_9GAMM|nr:FAD:protein FMN transferase [Aliidiomarina sanyensis]RUO30466.1 hypothetical protein CWE11_08815 [Aliidiomarina sanyensis]